MDPRNVYLYICMYICMYVCTHACIYVIGHVNCIRIKSARQFSQIQEVVMKSEKAVRSCQKKNENNRLQGDGNGGAFSSSDIYNMEMLLLLQQSQRWKQWWQWRWQWRRIWRSERRKMRSKKIRKIRRRKKFVWFSSNKTATFLYTFKCLFWRHGSFIYTMLYNLILCI